ncbi:hypothetical protein WME91_51585 [Sorangium sp. So ce269]
MAACYHLAAGRISAHGADDRRARTHLGAELFSPDLRTEVEALLATS